jgi:hypothetical protein
MGTNGTTSSSARPTASTVGTDAMTPSELARSISNRAEVRHRAGSPCSQLACTTAAQVILSPLTNGA